MNKQIATEDGLNHMSCSDRVLECLKNNDCDYICPFIQGRRCPWDPVFVSDNYLSEKALVEGAKLILPLHEEQDAMNYVSYHRRSQRLNHNQNLLMVIA